MVLVADPDPRAACRCRRGGRLRHPASRGALHPKGQWTSFAESGAVLVTVGDRAAFNMGAITGNAITDHAVLLRSGSARGAYEIERKISVGHAHLLPMFHRKSWSIENTFSHSVEGPLQDPVRRAPRTCSVQALPSRGARLSRMTVGPCSSRTCQARPAR